MTSPFVKAVPQMYFSGVIRKAAFRCKSLGANVASSFGDFPVRLLLFFHLRHEARQNRREIEKITNLITK